MNFSFKRSDFPEDFLFGVATAAYQIEGSQYGNGGSVIWDTFSQTHGTVYNFDHGKIACDHYNRFEEDLDLIKSGGFDSYRFSTSWSRVMPDGRTINEDGLDFYDRLVDAMLERQIKPNLTLYHWDLPSELNDIGGWANREVPLLFADYTKAVIQKIGDRLDFVSTINEPFCVAWLGYFAGLHAPGIRDIRAAIRAMHHIMLAHGIGVQALRSEGQKNLGIVLNLGHGEPASQSKEDLAALKDFDAYSFRWFMDSLFRGTYPEDMVAANAANMPKGYEDDLSLISQNLDWLGINYYTREICQAAPELTWPRHKSFQGPLPRTDIGWEIYPEGLEMLLKRVHSEYTGDLPLYVTENGMAGADSVSDGTCHDPIRVVYYDTHLQRVLKCIEDGVPMKGYYGWSLLDNYEWAYGYSKRFGLVHVDYETQKRTPKSSFKAFQAAIS